MGHQSSKQGNISPFHASIKNRALVKHPYCNKIIVVYVTVDAVTNSKCEDCGDDPFRQDGEELINVTVSNFTI